MDLPGAIILLGGVWLISAPFVLAWAIRRQRWLVVAIYGLPAAWAALGLVWRG